MQSADDTDIVAHRIIYTICNPLSLSVGDPSSRRLSHSHTGPRFIDVAAIAVVVVVFSYKFNGHRSNELMFIYKLFMASAKLQQRERKANDFEWIQVMPSKSVGQELKVDFSFFLKKKTRMQTEWKENIWERMNFGQSSIGSSIKRTHICLT